MISLLQISNFLYSFAWAILITIYLGYGTNFQISNYKGLCTVSGFIDTFSITSSFVTCGVLIWMMQKFILYQDVKIFYVNTIIKIAAIAFGGCFVLSLIPVFFHKYVETLPWDCSFDPFGTSGKIAIMIFEVVPFLSLVVYALVIHQKIRQKISERLEQDYFQKNELKEQGYILLWYTFACFFTWLWYILYDLLASFSRKKNEDYMQVDGWIVFRIISDSLFQLNGFFTTCLYLYFVKKQMSLHSIKRIKDSELTHGQQYEPLIQPQENKKNSEESIDLPIDIDENNNVVIFKKQDSKKKNNDQKQNKKIIKQPQLDKLYLSSIKKSLNANGESDSSKRQFSQDYSQENLSEIQEEENSKKEILDSRDNYDIKKRKKVKKTPVKNPLEKYKGQIVFKDHQAGSESD